MGNCFVVEQQSIYCSHCDQTVLIREGMTHKCWKRMDLRPDIRRKYEFPLLEEETNESDQCHSEDDEMGKTYLPTTSVKVPVDDTYTKFKWVKKPSAPIRQAFKDLSIKSIKDKCFQTRKLWFFEEIKKLRIDDEEEIYIDELNLLQTAETALEGVNLRKDLYIEFQRRGEGEDNLRRLIDLITQEMVLEDNGIFVKCETDEVVYKFKTRNSKISEKSDSLIELFGKVIAKALMERIPIKMHLNRTILRQIAMKELKFCDFYNFDKDEYTQWNYLVENPEILSAIDFNLKMKEGSRSITLKPSNIKKCLAHRMKSVCSVMIERQLQCFKKGMFELIPPKLFSIFEPHELDSMISGFIDEEGHYIQNQTILCGYKRKSKTIENFWKALDVYKASEVGKLLEFWIGKDTLGPEDGNLTITRVNYSYFEPFIRSDMESKTLFLPCYGSYEELKKHLDLIACV